MSISINNKNETNKVKLWADQDIKDMLDAHTGKKPRDIREKSRCGFAVTVFSKTNLSFVYFYHFQGRKRRMTLGKYPLCTLSAARKLHRKAQVLLESGEDPAQEKKNKKIINRDAFTIEELIAEYIEKWAKPRKRSWKEDLRCLNKDIKTTWGKRKAKDISRRDVILLLDSIKERGAPIGANRTLACIRRMFNFAIERDIMTANPCVSVKPVAKENRKDRVISKEEIKVIWNALDQNDVKDPSNDYVIHMSPETRLVLKLQLVLAQRKGEILSAEWDEVDLNSNWWTIPAAKAKNNQAHRVPLSPLAIELLTEVKKLSGDSRFLFPAKRKDAHIAGTSIDHAVRRSTFDGVKHWTPHDLRRSAASHMTSIGISRLVVSKILNHSERSNVTAIYDRHSYDREKRHALEHWAKELQSIIQGSSEGSNVVSLKLNIK